MDMVIAVCVLSERFLSFSRYKVILLARHMLWWIKYLFSSVQFMPVIAPVGWGHLLRCFWNQVAEMYGLAQLGHLKQPRSPACPTNNEQLWLNSSLLSSSEASRPAKLQMWLTSSAKSATRVLYYTRKYTDDDHHYYYYNYYYCHYLLLVVYPANLMKFLKAML